MTENDCPATQPVRIGVDGYNIAMARGTGVATYGRVLCETLLGMGHSLDGIFGLDVSRSAPATLKEILFFGALSAETDLTPPKLTLRRLVKRALLSPLPRHLVSVPQSGHVVSKAFDGRLPRFDRLFTLGNLFDVSLRYFRRYHRFMPVEVPDAPAIMHWTYPLPIRLVGAANIYTIHDLVPLRMPHTSTEDKRYHFRLIQACLRNGDHIVTVSESSRRDILDMFPGADPARITNTYQAVHAPEAALAVRDVAHQSQLRSLFDLEQGKYFLYFGALEPKKNIGRLIEAYLASEIETPLVIVGGRAWRAENELRLLNGAHGANLRGAGRIRQLDYLPERLLMLLVRGARAALFPSLYEGFGLPVLEAMTMGVPVLTSTTSAMPEIVGEAALKVDPYDVDAIVHALRRLDTDDALRDELAKAGPKRAAEFSSGAYAKRLREVYEKTINSRQAANRIDTLLPSRAKDTLSPIPSAPDHLRSSFASSVVAFRHRLTPKSDANVEP